MKTLKRKEIEDKKEEKLEAIDRAIELIEEAQCIIDDVVSDMSIRHNYRAYGRYGFDTLLGNGNPYDDGLQSIQKEIEEPEETDEEEE